MTYTKTFIQRELNSLITDRMRVIETGKLLDDGRLRSMCHRIRKDLDTYRHLGHNAHRTIVRTNAQYIFALACTISNKGKHHQRDRILKMVSELSDKNTLAPIVHEHRMNVTQIELPL